MENIHKKFADELIEVEKLWNSADHLIYVTFPVVKDIGLLVRAFENLYKGLVFNISSILKLEYFYKRINLSQNTDKNLEVFIKKCSAKYGLDEDEGKIIKEIIFLGKKHKESGFEFSKNEKIVILDDNLGSFELDIEKLKVFVKLLRKLLENTNRNFRGFL